MGKKFLLIGYNFHPEPTGIGKYSGEMIYWLAERGYDCTVITSYPYYPYWKTQEPYVKSRFCYSTEKQKFSSGGSMTICRCPMYVPTQPSGIKRVLLDFSFLISAAIKLLQLAVSPKFDFVFVVAPSFQFGLLGVLYKKFRKAKFLYHIQDMQIEAARDLRLIRSEKVINLLFKTERYIFDRADTISSISHGMIQRIRIKSHKEVLFFPNWADTKMFYPIANRTILKNEFGFEITDKVVLYSGAIGEKQGLEAILQAANFYRTNKSLKFVICGSGPYKQSLEDLAKSLDLQNLHFLPLQPFNKFNRFLNMADVHLVIQKSDASDLVMPSKLTTILSVGGLALITANENSSLYSMVYKHGIGLLVKTENQKALNEGILKAISEDNRIITNNARSYSEANLSIEKIMEAFTKNIDL